MIRIEQFLTELADKSSDFEGLMREHLESARFYLLGSMPEEYSLTLKLAGEILPNIQDDDLRKRLGDLLQEGAEIRQRADQKRRAE